MSDRERAAHAAATTDGDGARLRPPKTAQPPAASLTQAGRFLVLDREKRVADGERGGVFNCPRGGSRYALHFGRGRGQRQR